jgi:hypothetical protein
MVLILPSGKGPKTETGSFFKAEETILVYKIIVSNCSFRKGTKTETRTFFKAEKNILVTRYMNLIWKENIHLLSKRNVLFSPMLAGTWFPNWLKGGLNCACS